MSVVRSSDARVRGAAVAGGGSRSTPRHRVLATLTVLATAVAMLGLIDPGLRTMGLAGFAIAVVAAAAARSRGAGDLPVLLALAGAGFVTAAAVRPEFRADAPGYYAYLRSIVFDHDLDFANEWARWGFPALPLTATGRPPNLYPIGPALFWSPFFAVAHLYVLVTHWLGLRPWTPNGYDRPYLNALAAGSVGAVTAGGYALARSMAGYLALRQASMIVLGVILTSSIAYYTFVVPGMAHALTFSATCFVVWAWREAERAPTLRSWSLLGVSVGLVALMRWQGVLVGLLPAALAVHQLRQRAVRPAWIAAAAGLGVLAFLPQMLAWKLLFGRWLTMPQGSGYVDWSSPHLVNVLFSAERGFFDWTPLMLAGTLGLLLLSGPMPIFAGASLAVIAATAWVNGGVRDWEASDAFAARRFDVAIPLVAWGLAALARAATGVLRRRPWTAVAAVLAAFALWNAGLIRLYRTRVFTDAAPLERLAGAQAHQIYRLFDAAASHLGPRARGFVYDVMVGEYFYYNVNPSGTIDVGAVDSPWLVEGWSGPERREGWPPFRWALYPRACVRVPLQGPSALRSFIRLRAPGRLPDQSVRIVCNGAPVATVAVATEWTDVPFTLPAERLVPGDNVLCFEFGRSLPGEADGSYAAAVARVQLP